MKNHSIVRALSMVIFSLLVVVGCYQHSLAQICAGSSLRYIVRDAKGVVIDPAGTYDDSTSRIEALGTSAPPIKGATKDTRVIRWSGMCNFREPVKASLKVAGKVMNLTFKMPVFTQYESRSFLVDSIPFHAGDYEIDLGKSGSEKPEVGWAGRFFTAKDWKPVAKKP